MHIYTHTESSRSSEDIQLKTIATSGSLPSRYA